MSKKTIRQWLRSAPGFTLIELMISVGISSVIMLVLMLLFNTSLDVSALLNRSAGTTEFMADGVDKLNTYVTQVVHLRSCACSTGAAQGDCSWSAANMLRDPVIDLGNANPVVLLDADFEAGTPNTKVDPAATANDPTLTANLFAPGGYACGNNPGVAPNRGCRQRLRLLYFAPIVEAGATPSTPGRLSIRVSSIAAPGTFAETTIGGTLSRQGLVRLSCGLVEQTSGEEGAVFAINMRFKMKQSLNENPTSATYESWYPTSAKFKPGNFRDVKLRFSLANLANRGVYQWRMVSKRRCRGINQTGTVSTPDDCCTLARNTANQCISCVPSGVNPAGFAAGAVGCCSEAVDGGGLCR